jgi:hypothetical protein
LSCWLMVQTSSATEVLQLKQRNLFPHASHVQITSISTDLPFG